MFINDKVISIFKVVVSIQQVRDFKIKEITIMDKCQWCGKESNGYGMIVLTIKEGEESQLICRSCFNEYMVNMYEIKDFETFEKEIIFLDCNDIAHSFQIINRIHTTGVSWEAVEFLEGDKIGYLFQINQEFDEEVSVALKRLYKKVEIGLSKKFIERNVSFGREFNSFKYDVVEGRIEWDEKYEGNIPKFIIDGEEYNFDELGRMLMTYEGWNFKLEIIEPTE